jgi:hypothetical protein
MEFIEYSDDAVRSKELVKKVVDNLNKPKPKDEQSELYAKTYAEVKIDLEGFRYFSDKVNPYKTIESFVEYCRQNNITTYESRRQYVEQLYSDVLFYLDDFGEGNAQTYYHVIIETSEVTKTGENEEYFEFDKTDLIEIESCIVSPYLKEKRIHFDCYFIESKDIRRIRIKETQTTIEDILDHKNKSIQELNEIRIDCGKQNFHIPLREFLQPRDVIKSEQYMTDITKAVFARVKTSLDSKNKDFSKLPNWIDELGKFAASRIQGIKNHWLFIILASLIGLVLYIYKIYELFF